LVIGTRCVTSLPYAAGGSQLYLYPRAIIDASWYWGNLPRPFYGRLGFYYHRWTRISPALQVACLSAAVTALVLVLTHGNCSLKCA
jgi:hypothetical protein